MSVPASWSDRVLVVVDEILRACTVRPVAARPFPAGSLPEGDLSVAETKNAAALMRVNHAGEVSAQALYLGQSLTARDARVRTHLLQAAQEERDHLSWCATRVEELDGHTSRLGGAWFAGSLVIGIAAGLAGDAASLGFVAETERQVEAHLEDHLQRLPAADARSAAVLRAMAEDEARHGAEATAAGGAELPLPVQLLMRVGGEILRRTAYRV